ncbi:MAG: DUF2254 domain-containing protein [Methanophagales archaeon]|nr:DUF2254 domain-containing protein [Methanophagales archaeon]
MREKVRDWWVNFESHHLWTAHIFVYGGLSLFIIFVGAILFANFNLFHTDVNSARYMLSALVQSQAAIVAIVITLTLIAVQLTASAYSPRVINIFKKNPDMWILLGCYGVSIFYGFIVLKLVEGAEGEFVSQSVIWSLGLVSISFEFCVSLAYWLGAFTFVALFPYMWYIISLLKSENIIKRLAIEITRDKILNSKEDPIQPIMDIIHGSIMKYDAETTRVGLNAITKQVINVIYLDSEKEISGRYCSHLERVGRLAASREDDESTIEVVKNLENFGKANAERELEKATSQAVKSLEVVGRAFAEKDLGDATREVVVSLREVGRAAAEKGLEDAAWDVAEFLEAVGKVAMEKDFGGAAFEVIESLGAVGRIFMEKGLETATGQVVKALLAVRQIAEKVVASNLASLTLLNEGIIKTAIQDYESDLKEKDRDSFQKFMKIYEQKLEKLRAKKSQNKKTESR